MVRKFSARWDESAMHWWMPVPDERSAGIALRHLGKLGFRLEAGKAQAETEVPAGRINSGVFTQLADERASHEVPSVELYPYQIAGAEFLLKQRRALLTDQPGLGKTYQALAAVAASRALPALIVCPAGVRANWACEIETVMPWAAVSVFESRPSESLDGDLFVVSWEWLVQHRGALPVLNAVIADEAHYAKNLKSKRTKALLATVQRLAPSGMFVGLTGTPVVSGHVDLVPLLRACDAFLPFGGEAAFRARYCPEYEIETKVGQRQISVLRHRSLHGREMHQKLVASNVTLRRRKADVIEDLPAKQIGFRIMELPPGEAKSVLIEALKGEHSNGRVATGSDEGAGEARSRMPQEIGLISNLRRLTEVAKVPAAGEWAERWLAGRPDEKLVIFTHHREASVALGGHLDVQPLIGGVSDRKKQAVIRAFVENPGERVLVASYAAMGIGVNLQVATGILFLEQPWTPAACEQAEDRCHRIGQRSIVDVTYLIAKDTIDEPVWRLLDRKAQIVKRATDAEPQQLVNRQGEVTGQQVLAAVMSWVTERSEQAIAA